jgi:hypothetical protein
VIGGVADAGVRSNESKEHGGQMPDTAKVVINLAPGLEDAERTTVSSSLAARRSSRASR